MTIQQLIESVDRKTSYAWDRFDIIEAINQAARRVYNWVVKESPGKVFLKWDTSLTLTPGQAEYAMQADLEQIIRIREYDPGSGKWRIIHSTVDWNDLSKLEGQSGQSQLIVSYADEDSPFKYYGPYEKDDSKFYIMIQPPIDQNRQLEIIYSAQYVEVEQDSDYFMMPIEARGIVRDFAISELKEDNDDATYAQREQRAMTKLSEYLVIVRDRALTDRPPKQEMYIYD